MIIEATDFVCCHPSKSKTITAARSYAHLNHKVLLILYHLDREVHAYVISCCQMFRANRISEVGMKIEEEEMLCWDTLFYH